MMMSVPLIPTLPPYLSIIPPLISLYTPAEIGVPKKNQPRASPTPTQARASILHIT